MIWHFVMRRFERLFPKKKYEDGGVEDDKSFWDRKSDAKREAKLVVEGYIKGIFDEKYPDPLKAMVAVLKAVSQYGFTFGNSQKLVNMTAKYMFLSTYEDEGKRKLFESCHCPMDGVMIDFVKRRFQDNPELKSFDESVEHKAFKTLGWNGAWSRLKNENSDVDTYKRFQDCIKKICEIRDKEIMPIEVDYLYWDE